jgi:HEAT repeats
MTSILLTRAAGAAALCLAAAGTAGAQSLASRVNRVRDGDVRFTFTLRPEVCGSGQSISWSSGRHQTNWSDNRSSRDVEYDVDCQSGPGRVVIDRRDGEVADLRFYVGGRWRASSTATDLGQVSTREAADYLISVAETNDRGPARKAIFPATLVDSVTTWPDLMRIARNERRPSETRNQAVFWLGQLAEEPATKGLTDLVGEDSVDREVRKQAIFALSQRHDKEGIPPLINIVRTNKDPELRRQALFWLAQSRDPRALDLIEEILAGKR